MALLSKNTTIGGKNPLLYKTISNTSVDLNTFHDEGIYIFNNLTNATNFPSQFTWTGKDNSAHLQVISFDKSKQFETIQIIYKNNNNTIYMRYSSSANYWTGWQRVWTAANDGVNSGLDADLLDNVQGSGYVRNFGKTYTDFNAIDRTGFYQLSNAKNSPDGTSTLWGCITFQTDGNTSTNNYLCQIAIKDNSASKQLYTRKRNGSNNWTAWEKIWTSGTDGSDSGLDADTVDGIHAVNLMRRNLMTTINLDTTRTEGFFGASKVTATDLPTAVTSSSRSGYGVLNKCLFSSDDSAHIAQYLFVDTELYVRNYIGNSWGNWKSIGSSEYDFVVTSQKDFDYLLKDSDWHGYKSIFFNIKHGVILNVDNVPIGNLDNNAIQVPSKVCKIDATSDTEIECHGFVRNTRNKPCSISNIIVKAYTSIKVSGFVAFDEVKNCKVVSVSLSQPRIYGFVNCNNLDNCSVTISYNDPLSYLTAFSTCNNLHNCNVAIAIPTATTSAQMSNGDIYNRCNYMNRCTYTINNTSKISMSTVNVFHTCKYLNECSSTGITGTAVYNFNACQDLIDCTGAVTIKDCKNIFNHSQAIQTTNLRAELKKVDGSGSGLDADLLDGLQGYGYAKSGTSSSLLTTGNPSASSSCVSQMYRFYDTGNVIGEGANKYYGIIQVYNSSSYYVRIAVSMTSGKVYRQTSGASAWNEITPKIEVLTADPTNPSDGQIWVVTG